MNRQKTLNNFGKERTYTKANKVIKEKNYDKNEFMTHWKK